VAHLRRFEHHCARTGIHRFHRHRHLYGQQRYRELTGWQAPAAGGPRSRELTPSQKRGSDPGAEVRAPARDAGLVLRLIRPEDLRRDRAGHAQAPSVRSPSVTPFLL
jgi:hypothetical protein